MSQPYAACSSIGWFSKLPVIGSSSCRLRCCGWLRYLPSLSWWVMPIMPSFDWVLYAVLNHINRYSNQPILTAWHDTLVNISEIQHIDICGNPKPRAFGVGNWAMQISQLSSFLAPGRCYCTAPADAAAFASGTWWLWFWEGSLEGNVSFFSFFSVFSFFSFLSSFPCKTWTIVIVKLKDHYTCFLSRTRTTMNCN